LEAEDLLIMSVDYSYLRDPESQQSQKWDGGCLWIGVGVILGGMALGLLFVVVSLTRVSRIEPSQEPVVTIIEAATNTPEIFPTVTQEFGQDQTPSGSPVTSLGAEFSIGDIVEIFGTEGQGLSLRTEPGLSSVVDGYGMDNEIFEIRQGPIETDGYLWWFLVSPYDNTKKGWGVGSYLRGSSP
jgi:hypothetical protein